MAQFIKNIACSRCREKGNDTQGNNLATYSDGSSYCWSCHHFSAGSDTILSFRTERAQHAANTNRELIYLPADAGIDYPQNVLSWIGKYDLTRTDMLNNGVLYSEEKELLIFPFWINEGLIGYQGRYFGHDKTKNKYYSKGKLNEIIHLLYNGKLYSENDGLLKNKRVGHAGIKTHKLVLVEDIISAIKVSKAGAFAMPLFGTNIKSRWGQIRVLQPQGCILWLDPDMDIKSVTECRSARLNGFKCHAVLSEHDPKEHSLEYIKEKLND